MVLAKHLNKIFSEQVLTKGYPHGKDHFIRWHQPVALHEFGWQPGPVGGQGRHHDRDPRQHHVKGDLWRRTHPRGMAGTGYAGGHGSVEGQQRRVHPGLL